MPDLISIITTAEAELRNQSLAGACAGLSADELLKQCRDLDAFRRRSENLYERVRALFFLYAIHRFHLPVKLQAASRNTPPASHSLIPFKGYENLLQRRFEEAIDHFLAVQQAEGPSDAISSALAAAVFMSMKMNRVNSWSITLSGEPSSSLPVSRTRHLPGPEKSSK